MSKDVKFRCSVCERDFDPVPDAMVEMEIEEEDGSITLSGGCICLPCQDKLLEEGCNQCRGGDQ